MGLTVPLDQPQLAAVINYFLSQKQAIGLFWAAIISYQYLSGARISEVIPLRRFQIADEEGRLHPVITRKKLKSTKNATHIVHIDPDSALAQIVCTWLQVQRNRYAKVCRDDYAFSWGYTNKPFGRISAYRAYQRAYRALNLDYVSRGTHAVRKTSAAAQYDIAFEQSGDGMRAMQIVQRFLSHKRIDTTQAYLPINPGNEEEIAKKHSDKIQTSNILRNHYLSLTYAGSHTTQPNHSPS